MTFPKGWKGRWEVHSFLQKVGGILGVQCFAMSIIFDDWALWLIVAAACCLRLPLCIAKHYAFFDGKGLRVDEASDSEDDDDAGDEVVPPEKSTVTAPAITGAGKKRAAGKSDAASAKPVLAKDKGSKSAVAGKKRKV